MSKDIFEKREYFKPFEYPEIEKFAKGIQRTFWVHDEVDFTADVQHFKVELNDTERYIIGTILKTFATTEVHVADEFWGMIGRYLPKPEIALVASTFTENEWRHAMGYDRLNQELGLTDYESFLKDDVANERLENLMKIGKDNKGNFSKGDVAKTLAIFGAFTENVNLFSQFAILRSFSSNGRNLLPNIGNIIDWSALDESLHAQCAMYLFNNIMEENPELFTAEFKTDIYVAARLTYEIEVKLIDQIFARGELPNLSKSALLNFMKDRINQSLRTIKLKPIFDIDKELLKELQWFYDEFDGEHHTDFFAKRPTSYSKKMVVFDKDSVKIDRNEIKKLING